MKRTDPTIDRIREVRHQISAEFGHDPKKLVAFYASLEKELPAERFVEGAPALERARRAHARLIRESR